MRTIYFLELTDSKFFLLVKNEPVKNINRFFLKSALKYDFLKQYFPIKIVDQCLETHPLDVDILVKKQMLLLGIDNVRGGSYSEPVLTSAQLALLDKELYPERSQDSECPDEVINRIIDKYGMMPFLKIWNEKYVLKKEYLQYKADKKMLESVDMDVPAYRESLAWILEKCRDQTNESRNTVLYQMLNREDMKTYEDILPVLEKIYKTFHAIYDKPYHYPDADNIPYKYPRFLLDDYFYHGHRTHLPESIERTEQMVFVYSFFLTYIENRIDELKFDVASWGPHMEHFYPRAMYFLEKC